MRFDVPADKSPANVIFGLPVAHEYDKSQQLDRFASCHLIIFLGTVNLLTNMAIPAFEKMQS
jgi:hypothetical protein